MEYLNRELERKFLKMNQSFKAIMVTGARQVGKTTMLCHLAEHSDRKFVTMDNLQDRELARRDPKLFFQMYRPPVMIDEVQKAPELFDTIKEICDQTDRTGLFWLTGSESGKLLKEAGDSLAGRVCILRMYGFSQREKLGLTGLPKFSFELDDLLQREKHFPENSIMDVFEFIWRGTMPGTMSMDQEQLQEYYNSYVDTYLMRDAIDDNGITNTEGFLNVLRACAAFTGNLVNYSDLAAAGGVSVPTAKSWLKVLQSMGVICLLEPWSNTEVKRLVKTPKLYFCDTGLAAFLSMWTSRDVLMNGAASGHYFENYVVIEFMKLYSVSSSKANLTFYRDSNQNQIDLVIEENGLLHPIEIKRSANPDRKLVKRFRLLHTSSCAPGRGAIVCMTDRVLPLDENNCMIPCNIV